VRKRKETVDEQAASKAEGDKTYETMKSGGQPPKMTSVSGLRDPGNFLLSMEEVWKKAILGRMDMYNWIIKTSFPAKSVHIASCCISSYVVVAAPLCNPTPPLDFGNNN
jgi:hypothetical protein